jgi:hypothetical protein
MENQHETKEGFEFRIWSGTVNVQLTDKASYTFIQTLINESSCYTHTFKSREQWGGVVISSIFFSAAAVHGAILEVPWKCFRGSHFQKVHNCFG